MQYVISIVFLVILFQDVRYRGVHWFVFPVLLAACFYYTFDQISLLQMGLNCAFLIVLLLSLTIYLSLKENRLVAITDGYFSLGDILFLVAIAPLFELRMYMFFFVVGTISTLLIHLVVNLIRRQKTLPYAGYMSIAGIIYLFMEKRLNLISNYF